MHRFSFGLGGAAGGIFNSTSLTLSGYWRAPYSGIPWTGTTTAGTSGGIQLDDANSSPSVGATVNGYAPADFDGVSNYTRKVSAPPMSDYITASAYTHFTLFYADIAATDTGSSTPYNNPGIWATSSAGMGMAFSTGGISAWHFDGSNYVTLQAAASTGTWHLAIAVYDGANLTTYIDSVSGSAQSRGNVDSTVLAYTPFFGRNYDGSSFFNGKVLEYGFSLAAFTSTERANLKTYINSRYALSL